MTGRAAFRTKTVEQSIAEADESEHRLKKNLGALDLMVFGIGGVIAGAAIVFFAFIGFDIVATTAEEARDPQRDIPRGTLGALVMILMLGQSRVGFAMARDRLIPGGLAKVHPRFGTPDLERSFRVPAVNVVAGVSVLTCVYLMLNLTGGTWLRFLVWMAIGLVVYFTYGIRKSRLAQEASSA